MDITPQSTTTQSTNNDQELAAALAGVLPEVPEPAATPAPATPAPVDEPVATDAPAEEPAVQADEPVSPTPTTEPVTPAVGGDLDSIKKDALGELRPLIDKVELPAEEKFDTYLMLIRATDDTSLIAPAHSAALAITDEKRKAEALLEVIKEIDYLSRDKNAA